MTDPKRLLDESSEEERRLLQAGAGDEPPADGAARLALAMGVPLAAASSPPSPPGGAEGGLVKSGWAKLAGAKFVKAALIASAGAAVALTLTTRAPTAPSRAPSPASTNTAASEPRAAPAQQASTATPSARSLAHEVARLDQARRALAARKPDAALSTLDVYRADHPQGTLAPEALRLRVEAWLAKGDLKRARALARTFLHTYPQSPHAAMLRRIAEREPNDEAAPQP